MARRTSAPDMRPGANSNRLKGPLATARPSRIDKLVELIDHCTAAKETADELGEQLLSYLLAMAIQESRLAMRQTLPQPGN